MSLQGFQEHPIFGWGPENYNILFNKYYNPELYPVESWFDRSHNAFLDVLVNTGLVGFSTYCLFFILALWSLWLGWIKEKINYQTAVIFTVILGAYAIQNFFVFDTQVTLLMLYSVLAFIGFLSVTLKEETVVSSGSSFRPNMFLELLIFSVLLSLIYFLNINPGLASTSGIKALYLLQNNQIKEASDQFEETYKIGTFGLPEIAARAFDAAMQAASSNQIDNATKKEMADTAISGLKKALEYEPLNARYMMMMGNVSLITSSLDISYLAEADNILSQALELSPTRQELLFSLGQVRASQGRVSEALAYLKKAVDLNDKVSVSHWNYGLIAISLGQKEIGEAEVKKAVQLGYGYNKSAISRLISAYSQTKDFPKMISLYQEMISMNPNDAAAYAGLAATYAQAGDKQKAKEAALKSVQIDSAYQAEAEQFIKGLGL
jgi:pentatricopeptide repeat protein